ncbi:MAG: hypothetical protein KC549_02955, partial [Myxococcales bacterium]|nr:hypothetical protein [Myxococcales bacterium]
HDADDAAEPFDTLALGTAGMFSLLVDVIGAGELVDVGPRGVDLADILNLLGCIEGANAAQALADDRGFPWEVDERARCEKGTVPPPFRLVSRAGQVWLEPDGPLPALRLRRAPKDPPAPLHCLGPCALGPADPDALYLVSAQDQPWAGAMWAGPSRLARAAGGRVHQGLRLYPSAASR